MTSLVKKDPAATTPSHRELRKHYRSARWAAAADIPRSFVKHPAAEDSPAAYWKHPQGDFAPELSVVVPTKDGFRGGYFPTLLDQIARQRYSNFEVVIVKGDPRQGRAINTGAAVAAGRYLLTLDDDTFLHDPQTFGKLSAVLEAYPKIGMAGGNNVIPEQAGPFVRRVMTQVPRRSWRPVAQITDSDLAEHPLLIMRKDVFKNVGGENELLPRGLDPYLRQEFRKAGFRVVVVPGVVYSHLPPETFEKLVRQFFRNGKQAAFCNKFYPQWVIETPDAHVDDFVARRPFVYRAARHVVNMVEKVKKRHWIYLVVTLAYAAGFGWGYLACRDVGKA